MKNHILKPSPRYLSKLRFTINLTALLILLSGILLSWLISLDRTVDWSEAMIAAYVTAGLDLLWWLPAILLSGPYYRSLSYEILQDEVIVRAGIVTQSVKHVPYRTVTNLTVKRGLLDRWIFDLGTLNIQTAGMSGTTGAEESLVGLPDVQTVYDTVATELRRFRGSMAPTAAEMETEITQIEPQLLQAILSEVHAIREAVDRQR